MCELLERRVLHLEAFASGDRHEVTRRVEDAMAAAAVAILDSHAFSGVALTLHFEATPARVAALLAELERGRVSIAARSLEAWRAIDPRTGTIAGTLGVTFVDGDPDLRRVVPAVPG